MTTVQSDLLHAIVLSIPLSEEVIEEARQQALLPLICKDKNALTIISRNVQLTWEQQQLTDVLAGIPYLILKGTATSIYYQEPLRRMLGDIDVIVNPQDYGRAGSALKKAGFIRGEEDERHVHYNRNGIHIELHQRFATLQTREQEQLLDGWIYDAIESPIRVKIGNFTFPMPEHKLNGLILLTHINQHLEEGLGLRQIIDFVMYIKSELPDENWPAFKEKTDQLGLTTLAQVVGKLGKMYLGLSTSITWCDAARETTVEKLLDYCFECGNFGHKDMRNNTVRMVMSHGRGIKGFFTNLQRQGTANWQRLKKQPYLKPVAWAYQLGRYIKLGLKTTRLRDFRKNWKASRRRNRLMDDLGATKNAVKR